MAKVSFAALVASADNIDGQLHMAASLSEVYGYERVSFSIVAAIVAPRGHRPVTVAATLDPPGGNWQTMSAGIYQHDRGNCEGNQVTHYFVVPCPNIAVAERGTYRVRITVDGEPLAETLEFTSHDALGPARVTPSQAALSADNSPSDDGNEQLLGTVQKMIKSADDELQQNQDDGQQGGDYYSE
ncbi:hypothetical protein [Mycobacteroides abscessus]|nr:hypothetical protein [Mycobacteroides abscessus]MDB2193343.1 hypothetical protein [Mycobacteroides abscessus subsp. abscessus]MDB2198516.1 hypothetical protein [Mycobacteroides abscessus subsp. abscessus]